MRKLINLREFCKAHGIKLRYLAQKTKMSDELLRYYLSRPELPTEIERAIRGEIVALRGKLESVQNGKERFFK